MEYSHFLSDDTHCFFRSPVRDIFKRVNLAEIYSFAGGYPPADAFPIDDIRRLSGEALDRWGAQCLQYGATQGVTELREAIARRYGVGIEHVQITSSSQQGIDLCTRILCNPGDIILTKNPTYLGALQSFRSYQAKPEGTLNRGNALRAEEKRNGKVAFIYVIPDFQNPTGETMPLEERMELIRYAEEHDLIIIEDAPYRELRYEGEMVPTLYSLCPERVLHLGSFSKIFAPGFRLGWMLGPTELLDQIYVCKQSVDLCPPILDQYIATLALEQGVIDRNIAHNIALYRHKRDTMLGLLEKFMPEGVRWTHPEGGLFLWLTLPEHIDCVALYEKALANEVAYVAGTFFHTDYSACAQQGLPLPGNNTMRLNFSFIREDRMEEGIRRLAEVIRSY